MTRQLKVVALALLLGGGTIADATAQQRIHIQFRNGRVWLSVQEAPVGAILREWARVGGTTLVNVDAIDEMPITIEFEGVTEREAISTLLREAGGYLIGARETTATTTSDFDRLVIVPPSTVSTPRAASQATVESRRAADADRTDRPDSAARPDAEELPEVLDTLFQLSQPGGVAPPDSRRAPGSTGITPDPDELDAILPRFLRQ